MTNLAKSTCADQSRSLEKCGRCGKQLHGKGALTDSSSDSDSHSQSGESPPRGLPYRASALRDDDVGSRAKGGVPKRSTPSKTGAPQGTPSPTPSCAAGASPEGEVRDYAQEVTTPTNVPHEIEGDDSDDDSDIIRGTDTESSQLERARTTTRGSGHSTSDPDAATL